MSRRLTDAAKIVDSRRARSRQLKVGASEVGVCRRAAGYHKHGVKPTDPAGITSLAAIFGTWYHDGASEVMRKIWGAFVNVTVESELIRGHIDALELTAAQRAKIGLPRIEDAPDVAVVTDLKTKRDAWMVDYVRSRGPMRSELFQVHIYALLVILGLIKPLRHQEQLVSLGPIPVGRVRLIYVARTGEDAEFVHEQDFDPEIAAEAMEWVAQIEASKRPEDLPRDQDGPELSYVCDSCPFRTACWGDVPGFKVQSQLVTTADEKIAALREYDLARVDEKAANVRKNRARAMLDAITPGIYTDGSEAFKIGWRGGAMQAPKPDIDAMVALFEAAGLDIPMLEPRPGSRSIDIQRTEPPEAVDADLTS